MKKLLFIPMLLLGAVFYSCEKQRVQEPEAVMQTGQPVVDPGAVLFGKCDGWYIASFQKERADITYAFNSFRLVFCPDKTCLIANDVFSVTGSWYLESEEEIPVKLNISLNKPVEALLDPGWVSFLNEINGNWDVVQYRLNLLQLQSRNGFKAMVIQRGALQ